MSHSGTKFFILKPQPKQHRLPETVGRANICQKMNDKILTANQIHSNVKLMHSKCET